MLLQQLITFCRVVEAGSFTRAAELLNLTQPAVTRQVAALEAELGEPLLDRQGRHFRLTAAGEIVYEHARRVVAVVDSARRQVEALSSPEQGQVSIACVTTTGLFTLPSLLAAFSRQYPAVRIRVWSGKIAAVMDRVLDGESDLGLVTMPVTHPRLESVPLFRDRVVLVASPPQAARLPSPLTLAHLAELDMIAYQAPSRFRTLIEAHLETVGVYPRVAMEFDSHEAVKTMVLLGYGVAMVPESTVRAELDSGALIELRVEGLPPLHRITSMLLRRNAAPRARAVENFIRLVLERYGAVGAEDLTEPQAPGAPPVS